MAKFLSDAEKTDKKSRVSAVHALRWFWATIGAFDRLQCQPPTPCASMSMCRLVSTSTSFLSLSAPAEHVSIRSTNHCAEYVMRCNACS